MRSIALANQKGGVGKTTTAIHLAHGLALIGQQVALVDLDPQGNAMVALQSMVAGEATRDAAGLQFRALANGLWILGQGAGHGHSPDAEFVRRLGRAVEELGVDWLVADCPPRMDEWGQLGLQICSEVVVPVQAEFLAMHGLSQIMSTVQAVSGDCRLGGVLATMVDAEQQICKEVVASLRSNLGSMVFETVILRDSMLVEAASHGRTVFEHAPWSKAAFCYGEFLREVCNG